MEFDIVNKSNINIIKIINKKYFIHLIRDFSKILNIPSEIIKLEAKQILYRDKNYRHKSFYNFYNKRSCFKNIIFFLFLNFFFRYFSFFNLE